MSETENYTAYMVRKAGSWLGDPVDRVVLDYDDRFRRRVALNSEAGKQILLSLADAERLEDGDALVLDTGDFVEVKAAAEALIDISCADGEALLKMSWHLGNRHLPAEIRESSIRIRFDKVILDMVKGLGAETRLLDAPFNPEGGAYEGGHGTHHGHDHD